MERREPPILDYTVYLAAYARAVEHLHADPSPHLVVTSWLSPANLALVRIGEEILTRELWKPSC